MINYIRLAIIFAGLIIIECSLYFVLEKAMVNGLLAGTVVSAVNFLLITLTVKWLFSSADGAPSGKAMLSILVYAIKVGLFAGLIAALIILREHYNIYGFLIGFTAGLAVIGVERLMLKK